MKHPDYKYHVAAFLTVAIWGSTFVSTKVLLANSLTPAEIFFLRFSMAFLCLGAAARWLKRRHADGKGKTAAKDRGRAADGADVPARAYGPGETAGPPPEETTVGRPEHPAAPRGSAQPAAGRTPNRPPSKWRTELIFAAAGITGGSLYFLTENIALEYAPASNVSLIVCTAPVWTALLLGLLDRRERISRRQIAGSAVALAGVVLVVLNGRFVLRLSPEGDLLALAAALSWMCYSLLIKRIGTRYPALIITRKVFFYGMLTILPVFLVSPPRFDAATLARPAVWGNLLFLGLVASMLCYLVWNIVMRRLGAVRTTVYVYLNPLTTMCTAALFIGERITPAAMAGAALILLGMWQAERGTHRRDELRPGTRGENA